MTNKSNSNFHKDIEKIRNTIPIIVEKLQTIEPIKISIKCSINELAENHYQVFITNISLKLINERKEKKAIEKAKKEHLAQIALSLIANKKHIQKLSNGFKYACFSGYLETFNYEFPDKDTEFGIEAIKWIEVYPETIESIIRPIWKK